MKIAKLFDLPIVHSTIIVGTAAITNAVYDARAFACETYQSLSTNFCEEAPGASTEPGLAYLGSPNENSVQALYRVFVPLFLLATQGG